MASLPSAEAATTRRYNLEDHGNFLIFGNTVGFDCRDNQVEKPIVGSVPIGLLGLFSCNGVLPDNDSGVDILWRSNFPGTNQATANNTIDPTDARSTAIFGLPAGAKVVQARLYWSAQRNGGQGAGTVVTFERAGVFSKQVAGDATAARVVSVGGLDYYQSSADVTGLIQTYGSGAYRVGNIQTIDIRTINLDVAWIAWNIVVFYHLDSEPTRNLSLFDGLERVSTSTSSKTAVSLNGFSVPASGFSAQLGIIAYEGDNEITGDQLKVNNVALSNTYNPVNNFFNRTSTNLGALAPKVGDLPQMSGRPASMAGYDADIIDITPQLNAGDTTLNLEASTTGDEYYLGVFVTAVSTIRPVFSETTKTVKNITRTDGRFLPGDTLEYLISTKNTGNDIGKLVTVSDVLASGITFLPGSLTIVSGANAGSKTDAVGDDQAEYNAGNRTITARFGTGANGTMGGDMNINDVSSLSFRVTIDATTSGTIYNQATITAIGQTAQGQGAPADTWMSGDGNNPNVSTPVVISTCATNADCPLSAPICDTTSNPHLCICRMDSDCPSPQVCSPTTKQCVECNPGNNSTCDPNGPGGICLITSSCGCNSNADCNGRVCDTTTHTCAAVNTDLSLTLTRSPMGSIVPPGTPVTYTLTAANNGQVPINGATLATTLAPNLSGATWMCMGSGGAVCPAASGTLPLTTPVNLPAGGKLVYTYTVTTPSDPVSDTLDFTSTLTPPRGYNDTNPADNTATDSLIIGTPPLGPDLSIDVTESPSTTDSSINYTVQVTNHGPGQAAGATVVYTVPPDAMITLMPGDGWQCDQPNNANQVICTRTAPIDVGMASPIVINVKEPSGTATIPLHIEVSATDGTGSPLTDPNPADNTIDRMSMLNRFQLAGGGFASCDCSMIPGSAHQQSDGGMRALLMLAGLTMLGLRFRRNRRPQSVQN